MVNTLWEWVFWEKEQEAVGTTAQEHLSFQQYLQVLVSLKFMAKPSARAGSIMDSWVIFRTGNFKKIFPSLATSLSKEKYLRNRKGMKNSTCPAKFLSLTRQKWILSHKFGKSFNVGNVYPLVLVAGGFEHSFTLLWIIILSQNPQEKPLDCNKCIIYQQCPTFQHCTQTLAQTAQREIQFLNTSGTTSAETVEFDSRNF